MALEVDEICTCGCGAMWFLDCDGPADCTHDEGCWVSVVEVADPA